MSAMQDTTSPLSQQFRRLQISSSSITQQLSALHLQPQQQQQQPQQPQQQQQQQQQASPLGNRPSNVSERIWAKANQLYLNSKSTIQNWSYSDFGVQAFLKFAQYEVYLIYECICMIRVSTNRLNVKIAPSV